MRNIIFLLVLFSLSSCTRYYYAPNKHNVPLLKEKNEVQLSGVFSTEGDASGFEVQAAYSPAKSVGIIANACQLGLNLDYVGGSLYEAGVGYYKPIPSKAPRISEKFVFELYGVGGMGRTKNYYTPTEYASTNFYKIYAQPAIGFTHNIFDVAFSTKIGVLNFYNVRRTSSTVPAEEYEGYAFDEVTQDMALLKNKNLGFIVEPSYTVRVGYKYVKATVQVGWSVLTNDADQLNSGANFNVGLQFSLAPRFRKSKETPK